MRNKMHGHRVPDTVGRRNGRLTYFAPRVVSLYALVWHADAPDEPYRGSFVVHRTIRIERAPQGVFFVPRDDRSVSHRPGPRGSVGCMGIRRLFSGVVTCSRSA
jgi:hypothetical protein